MRGTETNVELKTDEARARDDGNFHDIDAAFADHLSEITALGTDLHKLANGDAGPSHTARVNGT